MSKLLDCPCLRCGEVVKRHLSEIKRGSGKYCSHKCYTDAKKVLHEVTCLQCGSATYKKTAYIVRSKTGKFFCSSSCSTSYMNAHKKFGTRISKFELFCQARLPLLFPELVFIFNNKEVIGSELDIYIPQLRLAFELNGIVHYEPIYGLDSFEKTRNRDKRKLINCYELGIELAVVDTSAMSYTAEKKMLPYLEAIVNIINCVLPRISPERAG